MGWLFLLVSLAGAALTYNVYRPIYSHRQLSALSFFAGWITGELALHWVIVQAACTVAFVLAGALATWPGQLGLGIALLSWTGLTLSYSRATRGQAVVDRALHEALGPEHLDEIEAEVRAGFRSRPEWRVIARPFPIRHSQVERIKGIRYARAHGVNLKLDLYRPRSRPTGCPTLLQIHGGGWMIGSRTTQGLPLMYHLASRGWVCVSADYRLSPHATFPEHLIDCKRALAWIREHGAEYGANPDFVVVTGGSAGGHLCALVALTPNDPEYQPGFQQAETSVQGCVPFYGVYDFVDRHGHMPHGGLQTLLERSVMKAALEEAPEEYERASPIARVTADAPPFFVIHGDRDTLVPVEEARRFVEVLRERTRGPVAYAEMPGAQHAFELFPSLRSLVVVYAVERFCAYLHGAHLDAQRTGERAPTRAEASRGV